MQHAPLKRGLLRTVVFRLAPFAILFAWAGTAFALSGKTGINHDAPAVKLPGNFLQLCPLEERLFDDASDGRLDAFSLLDAALVASGVERGDVLRHYAEQQAELVDELWRSGKLTGSARHRAQVVFEFLHRRLLHAGYRLDCTDLRIALDEGRFNCVSASVLFNCLAAEVGLAVCGLEMPGHAMSRVLLSDGPLDVETTCSRWFCLLDDPQRQAEVVEKTVGTNLSQDRSTAREILPVQMAAMVYYNRGVDLLARRQFEQAAVVNAKAVQLDPSSTTARGNLLATINNWAIALGSNGQYATAAELLKRGFSVDPEYAPFEVNYVHVHHQWVEDLCGAGRFEEALAVLARAAAAKPGGQYFRQAPSDVYRRWARTLEEAPGAAFTGRQPR